MFVGTDHKNYRLPVIYSSFVTIQALASYIKAKVTGIWLVSIKLNTVSVSKLQVNLAI